MASSEFSLRGLAGLVAAVALVAVVTNANAATLKQIKDRGYIRVAVANEIPYGYMTSKGTAKGFSPSTAKPVLKRMGIGQIQWTVMPYGSLIPALKADRVDIVASSLAVLPKRCTQVDYSVPNSTYGEGLMVKKGNPKDIHGYKDFKKNNDLKMGIVSGADQLEFAHKIGVPDDQLVMLKANTDAASAVQSGRIDAYAGTQFTVVRLAGKSDALQPAEPFHDPVIEGEPVRSWGAYGFNKNNDKLRKAFNKQLVAYQKKSEWRETLQHFGMDEHSINEVHKKTIKQLCSQSSS
ncbi:ectoine/hydroxyectoine ABC transporter substrate-binding protein EhuB [Salinisphaera sp. USBA-960]|uniref:ectoine/hydroxyectoine ABC transporter substrate-binding protein EhuB n=1 Tax=Salinisphaera orenii TaxID=856731 RepID=UPI000DBE0C59|nr:ectoine/hydroxyectoine ABC transporter substrate-binding protein EhuB [Salifodinibacter halophilus]NNC26922.1 ectoine/hydroxyectoine ABC transporter substrate-binding protein EhuB [Salifodinibacter halophilus]